MTVSLLSGNASYHISRALGNSTSLWFEETVFLFELGVGVRWGFVEIEKTEVEAAAYVNITVRNDSFQP